MDIELEKGINEAMAALRQLSVGNIDFSQLDPVAKMMIVTLVSETKKINDYVDSMEQRLVERFCTDFIPRQKIEAMPAVCVLCPTLKKGYDEAISYVGTDAAFAYKTPQSKSPLGYIPIFNTAILPHKSLYLITPNKLWSEEGTTRIKLPQTNQMWLGIRTRTEVDCLKGLSLFIKGTNGITPTHICSGIDGHELDFATMLEMENIEMAEPFDAQQTSGQFFSFMESCIPFSAARAFCSLAVISSSSGFSAFTQSFSIIYPLPSRSFLLRLISVVVTLFYHKNEPGDASPGSIYNPYFLSKTPNFARPASTFGVILRSRISKGRS